MRPVRANWWSPSNSWLPGLPSGCKFIQPVRDSLAYYWIVGTAVLYYWSWFDNLCRTPSPLIFFIFFVSICTFAYEPSFKSQIERDPRIANKHNFFWDRGTSVQYSELFWQDSSDTSGTLPRQLRIQYSQIPSPLWMYRNVQESAFYENEQGTPRCDTTQEEETKSKGTLSIRRPRLDE